MHERHAGGHGHAHSHGREFHNGRRYDLVAFLFTLGRERRMRERTLDAARIAEGESVLDVGCGTGTLAIAAKARVGSRGAVHGVDPSPGMLARARGKAVAAGQEVAFDTGTAQSLPYPDATFDAVLCSLAFHHLPPDARAGAVAEMRRVSKPDGRVVVVEFLPPRGLGWLRPSAWMHAAHEPGILEDASSLLAKAGFRVEPPASLRASGLGYLFAAR